MYESHFSMSSRPFKAAPDVTRFFPAATMEDARERVVQCIERGDGPAIVIGPPGTGKTILLSVLAEWFDNRFAVALIAGVQLCTRRALLQTILHALDLPYKELGEGELRLSLIDRLQSPDDAGEGLLLLVDEVQSMPTKLLEELRMLTNLVRNGIPRARVVLAGTPAFEERLVQPQLEALQQRVAVRCYLMPFDRDETWQYVAAQLSASDATPNQLFCEESLDRIFAVTDGVPRIVNQVCDHALLLAMANGDERISGALVDEAWADLQQLPSPSEIVTASASDDESVIEFGSLDDFETASDDISATTAGDPADQIAAICQELASVESDGDADEVHSTVDPFGTTFEDEEIIVESYSLVQQTGSEIVCFPSATVAEQPVAPDDTSATPSEHVADSVDAEAVEPPSLEPIPLFVQPDVGLEAETDPVYPPDESSEREPDATTLRLEIVNALEDASDETDHLAKLAVHQTDDHPGTEMPQPVRDPEAAEVEPAQPEVAEPEPAQSENVETEIVEPEPAQPDIAEPEIAAPEVAETESVQPEIAEPEIAEPEIAEPEIGETDIAEPVVAQPVAAGRFDERSDGPRFGQLFSSLRQE